MARTRPEDIAKLLKGLVPGKTIGFEARAVTLEFYEKFAETLAGSAAAFQRLTVWLNGFA